MTSGNNTEKKRLNRFLKERGLLQAYKRDTRIQRRTNIVIQRDEQKIPLVLYRRNNKTVIARAYDLKPLARTKRPMSQTASILEKTRTIFKNIKSANWKDTAGVTQTFGKVKVETKIPEIKLDYINRDKYNNFYREHTERVRRRRGMILLNITFYARADRSGQRQTVEADSGVDLNLKRNFSEAWHRAFRRCAAQVNFSWKAYQVNWQHYLYTYSYTDDVLRPL